MLRHEADVEEENVRLASPIGCEHWFFEAPFFFFLFLSRLRECLPPSINRGDDDGSIPWMIQVF